jgi:dimethylhistidine N-methyltransferase
MEVSRPRERLTWIATSSSTRLAGFARDVRQGLTEHPKHLPCCYFYDGEGSFLFDEICQLPEYYLTRAEHEILEARTGELLAQLPAPLTLVELGSGSAAKTRLLIEALLNRQPTLRYIPIDICRAMVEESSRQLLKEYPGLEILAIAAEYREGLHHLRALGTGPKLILWLGSNVGNLHRSEAERFLQEVATVMTPSDFLQLGIDLRKDGAVLERAYDDSQGVTADFNLNLLARINRELGGHFDLDAFQHRAIYSEGPGRVEMYLVSKKEQRVRIDHLDREISLDAGEAIHTENSYKYSLAEIGSLAAAAGLRIASQWLDTQHRFSVNLLAPADSKRGLDL